MIHKLEYFRRSLIEVPKFSVILAMSFEVSAESKDNGKDKSIATKDKDKYMEDDRNAIIAGLQQLREQQKNIVLELTRVEDDKREHE